MWWCHTHTLTVTPGQAYLWWCRKNSRVMFDGLYGLPIFKSYLPNGVDCCWFFSAEYEFRARARFRRQIVCVWIGFLCATLEMQLGLWLAIDDRGLSNGGRNDTSKGKTYYGNILETSVRRTIFVQTKTQLWYKCAFGMNMFTEPSLDASTTPKWTTKWFETLQWNGNKNVELADFRHLEFDVAIDKMCKKLNECGFGDHYEQVQRMLETFFWVNWYTEDEINQWKQWQKLSV